MRLSIFKSVRNKSGSAILQVVIAGVVLSGVSVAIYNSSQQTANLIRKSRVVSAMTIATAQLKIYLTNPQAYICPDSEIKNCRLSSTFNDDVQNIFSNKNLNFCTIGACSISLKDVSFNTDGQRGFSAKMQFTGDIKLRDLDFSFTVPDTAFSNSAFNCTDPNKPLFVGFKPNGEIVCESLPSDCGAGEYVADIDKVTLKPNCQHIGSLHSCSNSQLLNSVHWQGGANSTGTCKDRGDVFEFSSFSPSFAYEGPPSPPNDCQGSWSSCSAPCDGGTQTYSVTRSATNGGASCSSANGATRSCNTQSCSIATNCQGAWSNCSKTCGGGDQTYAIIQPAANGGTTCEASAGETRGCNTQACLTSDGKCGPANKQKFKTAPADSNLCTQGTATAVTAGSIGGWSWTCTGDTGGGTAYCSANIDGTTKPPESKTYMCWQAFGKFCSAGSGKCKSPYLDTSQLCTSIGAKTAACDKPGKVEGCNFFLECKTVDHPCEKLF